MMKINEKNLAAFALSATPVDREGWLFKRGEVNRAYQKRWFVLKGNLLFYFEKRGDKEPVGVIILEGCTIELAEDDEQFGFKVVFHGTGNRNYALGAESQESMEQWMKALACASYDYMKLMVVELQRQLDEMDECEALATALKQTQTSGQAENLPRGGQQNGSPVPPPRRHNPFNTPIDASQISVGYRSHSIRSAPGRPEGTRSGDSTARAKISFRDLHGSYGRQILADFNVWKHKKRLSIEKRQEQNPLILL